MGRAPCCEKMGLKRGPWTPEEDQTLISYIQVYGHGNWRALPKQAGLLRCGKSCRLRWMNYLRPDIRRGNFSEEEEQTIINLHELLGNRWSVIAARLPAGRTDNEIKNVWHTHLKKRVTSATLTGGISQQPRKKKVKARGEATVAGLHVGEYSKPDVDSTLQIDPAGAAHTTRRRRSYDHHPNVVHDIPSCSQVSSTDDDDNDRSSTVVSGASLLLHHHDEHTSAASTGSSYSSLSGMDDKYYSWSEGYTPPPPPSMDVLVTESDPFHGSDTSVTSMDVNYNNIDVLDASSAGDGDDDVGFWLKLLMAVEGLLPEELPALL